MPDSHDYRDLLQHPLLTMPQPVGQIALALVGCAVAALFFAAIVRIRADRGEFLLVLFAALGSCGMEGWAEYMAMNYHPEIGGHIAYRAWGMPVPVHIALSYVLYFGGPGYGLLQWVRRGVSKAFWWRLFAGVCVGVLVADLAALNSGAWMYYGRQPFVVMQFPITWMFCNTAAIFGFTAIVHLCLSHLRGAQRLLTLLIAPVGLSMVWAGVCLPVGNALHSEAGSALTAVAACASIATCLLIAHLSIQYFSTIGRRSVAVNAAV